MYTCVQDVHPGSLHDFLNTHNSLRTKLQARYYHAFFRNTKSYCYLLLYTVIFSKLLCIVDIKLFGYKVIPVITILFRKLWILLIKI